MKRKIIISVAAIVILVAAVFAVISFRERAGQQGTETYDNMEDAAKNTSFHMDYPDRLGGYPATGFDANSSMIEVRYGTDNFIRKTLGVADNSGNKTEYGESREQSVNGIPVTMRGRDGLVYLAVWNDNNFAFTVSVAAGVTAEDMIEYVEATG